MASHYKLYDGLSEVVPFNAKYTYPTQANRAWKQNIKIPTTNGQRFWPGGSNPQITLPAQGYLNTRNSFIACDITIENYGDGAANLRFQNNIQSVFSRMLLRYGSLSLEDLRETGPLVRILTDGAATNTNNIVDQNAISEGIGGNIIFGHRLKPADWQEPNTAAALDDVDTNVAGVGDLHQLNTRVSMIQVGNLKNVAGILHTDGIESEVDTGTKRSRRYQFQLPFGMFQQNKLLPLKWMASQLTIELTLSLLAQCMTCEGTKPADNTRYIIENLCLDAELLEFDGSYDAAILEGLRGPGLPIKFASWDTFQYTPINAAQQTLMIPERNRSLKAIFCVQTPPAAIVNSKGVAWDSHSLLHSSGGVTLNNATNLDANVGKGHIVTYQWRIGGKYYPAQPVTCGNGTSCNGGAEAYRQLEKALNIVGDYRLSTAQNPLRWCRSGGPTLKYGGVSQPFDWPSNSGGLAFAASRGYMAGPSSFVIAQDLETSSGAEVAGLNGEEQNDITLNITYSEKQSSECQYLVYVYYDAMLVLRENNLVELIK